MSIQYMNKLTNRFAAEVDALRSRLEEHGEDMQRIDDDGDLAFDAGYAILDASALLEQAFDLLEEANNDLTDALANATEESVYRVDHSGPRTFITLIRGNQS
jgi:geranylgeranyl pyrophosphate synthase